MDVDVGDGVAVICAAVAVPRKALIAVKVGLGASVTAPVGVPTRRGRIGYKRAGIQQRWEQNSQKEKGQPYSCSLYQLFAAAVADHLAYLPLTHYLLEGTIGGCSVPGPVQQHTKRRCSAHEQRLRRLETSQDEFMGSGHSRPSRSVAGGVLTGSACQSQPAASNSTQAAKRPPLRTSSAGEPASTTRPASNTITRSACRAVASRWATVSTARPV